MVTTDLRTRIQEALTTGDITPAELRELARTHAAHHGDHDRNALLIRVLSYIGGSIIFLGVLFFVVLQWDAIPSTARILISLGASLVAYSSGAVLFYLKRETAYLPQALSLLALLLLPVGLAVTVFEFGGDLGTSGIQVLIAGITSVFALASYSLLRRLTLFLIFSIIAATWLVVALAIFLTDGGELLRVSSQFFFIWITIIIGASYLFLARALRPGPHTGLASVLEGFGVLGILVAALSGGTMWDILYPFVLAGAFAGSVYLANRGLLVLASIFLVGYLVKLTALHFADAIGWPVALIGIGAFIIAISYGAYRLNAHIQSTRGPGTSESA